MAKTKAGRAKKAAKAASSRRLVKRSAKRPTRKAATKTRRARGKSTGAAASTRRRKAATRKRKASPRSASGPRPSAPRNAARKKLPRLDRERRRLDETVQTPPSSLDLNRRGSAARTGRAELAESRQEHAGMSADITGGDLDVDVENAYFTGDEAPGGDNPTPDQEIVDDIGKALGVQYDDNEELKASDKIVERDKHRWEMDPASSEDYKDRK